MISYININELVPAKYNPRKISDKQFAELKNSIKELGFAIPIIVNRRNNVIIAGHQRSKAAKELGMKEVPCFWCDDIPVSDEIQFNQFHNGCDIYNTETIVLKDHYDVGFHEIDVSYITVNPNNKAEVLNALCKLILKYGNLFCAIVIDNKVVMHEDYIHACKILKIKANISVLPTDKAEAFYKYFSQQYGTFSYDHIKKNTFVQGLAQMKRLTGTRRLNKSKLYETMVLPYIDNNMSILDFGCGKGAYIEKLKKDHIAVGLEFYNNNGSSIDSNLGNRQINDLIKHINNYGKFDVVVCDSVLNSVDSKKAELSVLTCCQLLSKKIVFFSGRGYEYVLMRQTADVKSAIDNQTRFFDENKFTANYRKGNWYYQHFHTKEDIEQLAEECGLKIIKLNYGANKSSWQCMAEIKKPLPIDRYIEAVEFEFDLPLPNGGSYNRQAEVIDALKNATIL